MNLRYFLIRPKGKRKSFSLVSYILKDRVTKEYQELKPALRAQVASINSQDLSQAQKELLFQELIQTEYKKTGVQSQVLKHSAISQINQKIFERFWTKVYAVKFLVDERSPRYDILKAIRLIEPLSLQVSTELELQNALKKNCKSTKEHRRTVDRLNQLLVFLERDFKLKKPAKGIRKVQYVTEVELKQILNHVENSADRDLILTLFGSGCRKSEALALEPDDYKNGLLRVNKQLPNSGLKEPKRGKSGTVIVLPQAREAVARWVKAEDKVSFRYRIFDVLERACRKAFPGDKSKWIGPHDLRHSHAIYLLGKGASLTQVALNLRNNIDVCQEYYTGYAHSEDTAEGLKKIL